MQTRIYRKQYVDGSVNSEGHPKKMLKTRRDAYSGLDLSIHQKPNPSRETVPLNILTILISGCRRDAKEFLLRRESIQRHCTVRL
jgi:hypothetical protein